jgi:ACS family hexuronate transporter-like MFS transporter
MVITRRRVLIALLIVGAVINYADRQIIALLKPLIALDFHWSDAQYGRLAAGFQLAAAFGLLFAGWFVDRIGIKRANPIAVGAWSSIAMAQAFAHSLVQFGALRIALGGAEAMGTPVVVKSFAVLFPPAERSLAFGAMNAASTLGAIVTPLFVPVLASWWGWRSALLIVGASGIVWVAGWWSAARRFDAWGEAAPSQPGATRVRWREVLADRRTWAVAGGKLLSDQVWWFLLFWAPDLLQREYHMSMLETAVPLAVMYSCAALGAILGGVVPRQLIHAGIGIMRARKQVLLTCAVLALPIGLVPIIHRPWITVAVLGLALAAHQGFSANLFALITEIVPALRVATVTGVGAFSGNLGGMGILSFTGWILTREGGYGPVFLFASVSYLLALAWLQCLLPGMRTEGMNRLRRVHATLPQND